MGNYNFKKDLGIAKETETEIANLLTEKYELKLLDYNNTKAYDLRMENKYGKEVTFELKEDFMCEITGNVAVEYECRGKPSGISTTEAEFYIYKVHTLQGIKIILFGVDTLRHMINNNLYYRIVSGGDANSNTKNYLFKKEVFMEYGVILR